MNAAHGVNPPARLRDGGYGDGVRRSDRLAAQRLDSLGDRCHPRRGDLVDDVVQFLALQNRKHLAPDGLEGSVFPDAIVSEELQHLPGFLQVLIALDMVRVDPLPGGTLRLVDVPSAVVDKAVEQVIMQPLIAVVDKAEQVDLYNPPL